MCASMHSKWFVLFLLEYLVVDVQTTIYAFRVTFSVLLKQAANQNSQAGFGAVPQGQYAPTFAGGQPKPTGMAPQPLPLEGVACRDMQVMMRKQ